MAVNKNGIPSSKEIHDRCAAQVQERRSSIEKRKKELKEKSKKIRESLCDDGTCEIDLTEL